MDLGKDLTKRQQEIFDFIKKYSAKYGYPPTVRDIGKAVGLASSSTVHAHLANLEKLGLLRRDPSKPRAIELLDRMREDVGGAVGTMAENVRNLVRPGLPLVGHVAAGQPILAEENIEDYVQVPEIAGGDDGEYVLRVRGESMKNAGILPGDFVVVRPQDTAGDGGNVVALVGGGGGPCGGFFGEGRWGGVVPPRRPRRGRERDRDAGRSGSSQESLFGSYA